MPENELLEWLAELEQFDQKIDEITWQLAGRANRAAILEQTIQTYVQKLWFEDYLACCEFAGREPTVPEMEAILSGRIEEGVFNAFTVADHLGRDLTQRELFTLALSGYERDRATGGINVETLAAEMGISPRAVRRTLFLALSAVDRKDLAKKFAEETI